MSGDLGRKDFKDWRQRKEVFPKTNNGSHDSAFGQLLQEQGQKGDEKDAGSETVTLGLWSMTEGWTHMKMEMMHRLIQS